jgi:tape measure domain-containing protein
VPEISKDNIIAQIDFQFKKRALEEAKIAVLNLDKEILKLQKDALELDKGSAKFAKLTQEIGRLTQERQKLSQAIEKGDAEFSKMTKAAGLAGKALGALGLAFGAFEVVNFIKSSSAAAKQIESLAKSLEALGVSEAEAFELANKIDNLEAKVPFEGEQIKEAAINLKKFNVEAKDIEPTMLRLAAIAKGADVSLDSLSDTFGRANKNGVVFGRDFLQIYKNVPGLADEIAKSTGKTVEQIVKIGKQGKLSFEEFNKGVQAITDSTGKYGQVLEKFQQSTEGQQKALKESIGDLQEAFGSGFNEQFKKALGDMGDGLKNITPLFSFLGRVVGGLVSGIAALIKGFGELVGKPLAAVFEFSKKAASNIKEVFDAIDQGRLKLGGRLFIIEPKKEIEDFSKQTQEAFDKYMDLIREKFSKAKDVTKELTEEQIEALNEFKKKFQSALDEIGKVNIDFDIEFGSENQQQAAIRKIEEQGKSRIKALKKIFDSIKEEAKKLADTQGVTINIKPLKEVFDKAVDAINTETKERIERAKLTVAIPIATTFKINEEKQERERQKLDEHLKRFLGGAITVEKAIEIKITAKDFEDVGNEQTGLFPTLQKKLDSEATKLSGEKVNDKVQEIFKGLIATNIEGQRKLRESQQEDALFKNNFFVRLFGFDDEDQKAKFEEQLGIFTAKSTEAANTFIQNELNKTDFLISETEKRLNRLLELQEGGNVEQINLEQSRLDTLNEQRQKYLDQQRQLNQLQIVANNAITISESVKAIATAFGSSGNPFVGIAASIALLATIASTVSQLQSGLTALPAAYEGEERVGEGKSKYKPSLMTEKDNILYRVHKGERIVPEKENRKIPVEVTNKNIAEYVIKGLKYDKVEANKKTDSTQKPGHGNTISHINTNNNSVATKADINNKSETNQTNVYKTSFEKAIENNQLAQITRMGITNLHNNYNSYKGDENLNQTTHSNIYNHSVSNQSDTVINAANLTKALPKVEQLSIRPNVVVNNTVDNSDLVDKLEQNNKLLSEIKKVINPNINIKIESDEVERLRLKRMAG